MLFRNLLLLKNQLIISLLFLLHLINTRMKYLEKIIILLLQKISSKLPAVLNKLLISLKVHPFLIKITNTIWNYYHQINTIQIYNWINNFCHLNIAIQTHLDILLINRIWIKMGTSKKKNEIILLIINIKYK